MGIVKIFRIGETGVGEMGQIIGETGVGEMGVGEMGVILIDDIERKNALHFRCHHIGNNTMVNQWCFWSNGRD